VNKIMTFLGYVGIVLGVLGIVLLSLKFMGVI